MRQFRSFAVLAWLGLVLFLAAAGQNVSSHAWLSDTQTDTGAVTAAQSEPDTSTTRFAGHSGSPSVQPCVNDVQAYADEETTALAEHHTFGAYRDDADTGGC